MSRRKSAVGEPCNACEHQIYTRNPRSPMKGVVLLPRGFSSCWTMMFGTLSVEDVQCFIKTVMVAGKKWSYKKLTQQRMLHEEPDPHREDPDIPMIWCGDSKPSRHHLIPRSRRGKFQDNIVHLPGGFHKMWHQVFGNLTPAEACVFTRKVMDPRREWGYETLRDLRRKIMQPDKK